MREDILYINYILTIDILSWHKGIFILTFFVENIYYNSTFLYCVCWKTIKQHHITEKNYDNIQVNALYLSLKHYTHDNFLN